MTYYGIEPCKCITCKLHSRWPRQYAWSWEGCGLCNITRQFEKVNKEVLRQEEVPTEVLEFLKIKSICEFHFNPIDHQLRYDLAQCWATARIEVIELAICKALYDILRDMANLDFRLKIWKTKAQNPEFYSEQCRKGAKNRRKRHELMIWI